MHADTQFKNSYIFKSTSTFSFYYTNNNQNLPSVTRSRFFSLFSYSLEIDFENKIR
jgi:hypothetical protein